MSVIYTPVFSNIWRFRVVFFVDMHGNILVSNV
jgi:hypothetical protein